VQESWWYLIHKLSYSRFSDKIYQILLPWQQGWVYRKFEWLRLISQPPKPSIWCKILGPILNASWVMINFAWKFPNFRFHGNRGYSDTNFAYTVKLADPENPLFGARIFMISLRNWVMADFVSNWRQLVAIATRVGLTEIWIIPFDCPHTKNKHLARIFNGARVMALRSCLRL